MTSAKVDGIPTGIDVSNSSSDGSAIKPLLCGLIMPISTLDGCSPDHWSDVKSIVTEAIEAIDEPKFTVRLVSDADDSGVIQKRIVQNVYTSDIVVCDVSGKNPNVMFELGLRLAFDKPTIIIKDDKTDYTFDTGIIEHVPYPRDLRFTRMVSFKKLLAEKVRGTVRAAQSDPEHSTFLKNFGKFNVASLKENPTSADNVLIEMVSDLQGEMTRLRRQMSYPPSNLRHRAREISVRAEGAERIKLAVEQFFAGNPPIDLTAAGNLSTVEEYIFSRVDPMKYFDSHSEFRSALTQALTEHLKTHVTTA